MDLQRRGAAAVATGGTGGVTVPGWGGPGEPLWRARGGRAGTVLLTGGWPLVLGKLLGWSARGVVLPSHALVLFVHGGVGWWAVVVVAVVVVVVVMGAFVALALVVVVMMVPVWP